VASSGSAGISVTRALRRQPVRTGTIPVVFRDQVMLVFNAHDAMPSSPLTQTSYRLVQTFVQRPTQGFGIVGGGLDNVIRISRVCASRFTLIWLKSNYFITLA